MAVTKNLLNIGDAVITGDMKVNGDITSNNNFIPISLMLKTVNDQHDDLNSNSELLLGMSTNDGTRLFLGVPTGTDMNGITISYVRNSTVRMRLRFDDSLATYGKNRCMHKIRNLFTATYLPNEWPNSQDLLWFFIPEGEGICFQKNGYDYYHVKLHCMYRSDSTTPTYSLASIEIDRLVFDIPRSGSNLKRLFLPVSNVTSSVTLTQLLNNNKGGLCLYKNGKRISNICLLRTYMENQLFKGIGIKNS